jgi:hypothetical protein
LPDWWSIGAIVILFPAEKTFDQTTYLDYHDSGESPRRHPTDTKQSHPCGEPFRRDTMYPTAWEGLLSRRDLLRVGSLGIAATLLPTFGTQAASGRPPAANGAGTARSVILLWMAGGVTHLDSFDPKPDAPETIRGTLRAVDTTVPGIRFCEPMACLAQQAQHLAVVRSFSHDSDDHFLSQAYVLSGRKVTPAQLTSEPNIGAIVARLHGPRAGFPGYIAVPGTTRPGPPPKNLFVGGWLGAQYAPFACGGAPRNEDFTAKVAEAPEEEFVRQALQYPREVDAARLEGRRSLRERLEEGVRRLDAEGQMAAMNGHYQGAVAMLTSPVVRRAFDLRRELAATRERYGRTKIGNRCLLARRLVEAGARFVMVDYGYDPEYGNLWDNHRVPEQHQPHICDMVKLPYHLAGTDRACAGLVADLHERGLLGQTLVVFLTEFGRTPKINRLGGRDHWGKAGSIFFAGGGVRGGQVIGATSKHAEAPTSPGYSPADVAATIYRAIGIDPAKTFPNGNGRPMYILDDREPVKELL